MMVLTGLLFVLLPAALAVSICDMADPKTNCGGGCHNGDWDMIGCHTIDFSGNETIELNKETTNFQLSGSPTLQKALEEGRFKDGENVEWLAFMQTLSGISKGMFKQFPGTKYLILHYNTIPTIKKGAFLGLPNVRAVDLSDSHVEALHDGIVQELPSLKQLILKGNNIRFTPRHFINVEKLTEYSITAQSLTDGHDFNDSCLSGQCSEQCTAPASEHANDDTGAKNVYAPSIDLAGVTLDTKTFVWATFVTSSAKVKVTAEKPLTIIAREFAVDGGKEFDFGVAKEKDEPKCQVQLYMSMVNGVTMYKLTQGPLTILAEKIRYNQDCEVIVETLVKPTDLVSETLPVPFDFVNAVTNCAKDIGDVPAAKKWIETLMSFANDVNEK